MVDIVDAKTRSKMMSRIRGKNTSPELTVRKLLHRAGLRFKLHESNLPGRPDIVLPRHRSVVFVHGCFWHRHPRCRKAYQPKSRVAFWTAKFISNVERDRRNVSALRKAGWSVFVVWECKLDRLDSLPADIRRAGRAALADQRRRARRKTKRNERHLAKK